MRIVFTVFNTVVAKIEVEDDAAVEPGKVVDSAVKATSRWWTSRMTK